MEPAPQEIADAVQRELAGEGILWAGSPDRWSYVRSRWSQALFGIPFLTFALFWTFSASHAPARASGNNAIFTTIFPLWGLLFVGVGAVMILTPFFMAWRASNVYYVVTPRRAVIFEKLWKLNIRSFNPAGLANFERVSNGGSSGSIVFQRLFVRAGRGTREKEIGFIGLKDFRPAEKAITQLVASQAKG
ncbi:MAG: hypothetical protein ACREVL_13510 [Solimonas sp.]